MPHRTELGEPVENWTPPPRPDAMALDGRYCTLERLSATHAAALHAANLEDREGRNWEYLPYGPFDSEAAYRRWVEAVAAKDDPRFFAIKVAGRPVGVASYLRINPDHGSIEVGHINFSPLLQRSRAATEAMYLMMRWAFEAGYRRYEWKCNALNRASRDAAMRLGLSFEGVFRQMMVVKGRNRDTAWYAAIDKEWPRLREAFEAWLAPENFDETGRQRRSLSALTKDILVKVG